MPLPWIVNNLYGLASRAQANERGLDATEQLMDKMKAQYNDPGPDAVQRPPDPEPLFNRTEAIAQAQGGQAAFNYLLGQTDPAQLAQIQAQQARTKQSAKPSSVREYEYYQKLTPSNKGTFDHLKRSQQFIDTGGGGQAVVSGPRGTTDQILSPQDFAAAQSQTDITLKDDMRRYGEQVALPDVKAKANSMIKIANEAIDHPGFKSHYGWLGVIPAAPGSDAASFATFVNQGQGRVFLQAYESLKGAGQVTEVEGLKAEQALARISDRKQSPESARKAWTDLQDVVKAGLARQEAAAATSYGVEGPTQRYQPQPKTQSPPKIRRYVPGKGFE
jgi:hypothetical protein